MREIAIELDSPFQLDKLSCSKIALLHHASGLPYNLLPPSNSNFNVWLHGQAGQKDRQLMQVEEVPADLSIVYTAREITSSNRFRISIDNCIGIRLTF